MTFPKEGKEAPCLPVHVLLRMAVAGRYTLREILCVRQLSRYSDSLTMESWLIYLLYTVSRPALATCLKDRGEIYPRR
jgi:hypothetical protein